MQVISLNLVFNYISKNVDTEKNLFGYKLITVLEVSI